jgi:hypothetical protein
MSRQERTRALAGGCAGLALLGFMFLPWFEIEQEGGADSTAWESFGLIDIVLAIAVASSLATAALSLKGAPGTSVVGSSITTAIGGIAFLLVLYRLIDPPGGDGVDRELGAWLGLAASGVLVAGAYLGIQED